MKKVLFTLTLTFILLISFWVTNVSAIVVTEDSFKQSLVNIFGTQASLVEMDTSNDIITFTPSGINIKYNFNNNPTFTTNLEFNKNMSEIEYQEARRPFNGFINMFGAVADHFSVDPFESQLYCLDKIIKNDKLNKLMIGPSNLYNSDDLKKIFDTDINFSDKLFNINSNKILDTGDTYEVEMTLAVDLNGDFSKISDEFLEYEEEQDNIISDEALNRFEAYTQSETLVDGFKKILNINEKSVLIDDKLYLKYSDTTKNDIYKFMTSNAQNIFEKNTNYFKKSNENYYDTGRLRTLPIIYNTDTYSSKLNLTSATENAATFDVIITNIKTGKTYDKYTDGLKIVKIDDKWLIDSLKFKSKIEKTDTYPESSVIKNIKNVVIIPPSKTSYKIGEKLDTTGLKITVVYADDTIETIKNGYQVTGYNKNKNGLQTLTIKYKDFTKTFNVKVGNYSSAANQNANNNSNNNNIENNNNIDNIEKLPQTGDFFDLMDVLYILLAVSSILLICIIRKSFKKQKYSK